MGGRGGHFLPLGKARQFAQEQCETDLSFFFFFWKLSLDGYNPKTRKGTKGQSSVHFTCGSSHFPSYLYSIILY